MRCRDRVGKVQAAPRVRPGWNYPLHHYWHSQPLKSKEREWACWCTLGKGTWVSAEAGVQEWPLAELPASIRHGQSPGSRLWNIMLGNPSLQSICQCFVLVLFVYLFSALFPSNSRQLLSKSIPPRCMFPGHIFTPSHLCGNVTYFSPLHSFCCRYFLKKVPKAEIFIVTFPFLLPEPAICCQASRSDVQNAFFMLKLRSLRCSVPCMVHFLTSSMERPADYRRESDRAPLRWRRQESLGVIESLLLSPHTTFSCWWAHTAH